MLSHILLMINSHTEHVQLIQQFGAPTETACIDVLSTLWNNYTTIWKAEYKLGKQV